MDYGCPECGGQKLIICCSDTGGWLVKCSNSHELFPFPGATIVAYDFDIAPTSLTFGTAR